LTSAIVLVAETALVIAEEPQRITIYAKGKKPVQVEHCWPGITHTQDEAGNLEVSEELW